MRAPTNIADRETFPEVDVVASIAQPRANVMIPEARNDEKNRLDIFQWIRRSVLAFWGGRGRARDESPVDSALSTSQGQSSIRGPARDPQPNFPSFPISFAIIEADTCAKPDAQGYQMTANSRCEELIDEDFTGSIIAINNGKSLSFDELIDALRANPATLVDLTSFGPKPVTMQILFDKHGLIHELESEETSEPSTWSAKVYNLAYDAAIAAHLSQPTFTVLSLRKRRGMDPAYQETLFDLCGSSSDQISATFVKSWIVPYKLQPSV